MPKKLNLRIAERRELFHFPENGIARAAALRTAREWHHTIRARLVAALNNRQVGAPRIIPSRHLRLKRFVGIRIQPGDALIPCFQLRQHLRQFAVACGTANQAHPGRALEDLLAFLLRHAAQHSDHLAFALLLPVFAQPRKNLLRRLLANAAGVVKD